MKIDSSDWMPQHLPMLQGGRQDQQDQDHQEHPKYRGNFYIGKKAFQPKFEIHVHTKFVIIHGAKYIYRSAQAHERL